jgi:Ca-activated chloride channel homolog
VLANLKLSVGPGVSLNEVYPPQLPDLFHGTQLVVLGRFTGNGHAAIKLTGNVGKETREFVYEINFPDKTAEDKSFVEDLWARRKVGYLLDQIRLNGEKKELKDEVITLAKKYGIATPWTSYLIVPDAVVPLLGRKKGSMPNVEFQAELPPALAGPQGEKQKLADFIKDFDKKDGGKGGGAGGIRGKIEDERLNKTPEPSATPAQTKAIEKLKEEKRAQEDAKDSLKNGDKEKVQAGSLGVSQSLINDRLRNQSRLTMSATRNIANRTVLEVGGLWIDETFNSKIACQLLPINTPESDCHRCG